MSTHPTATPRTRTDKAAIPAHYVASKYGSSEMFVPIIFARTLERELQAAQSALAAKDEEVRRLREHVEMALRCFGSMPDAPRGHTRDGVWSVWTDGCNCLRAALAPPPTTATREGA